MMMMIGNYNLCSFRVNIIYFNGLLTITLLNFHVFILVFSCLSNPIKIFCSTMISKSFFNNYNLPKIQIDDQGLYNLMINRYFEIEKLDSTL